MYYYYRSRNFKKSKTMKIKTTTDAIKYWEKYENTLVGRYHRPPRLKSKGLSVITIKFNK